MTDCQRYSPDIQAQGDCRNCGHTYDAHQVTRPPKPTPTRPQTTTPQGAPEPWPFAKTNREDTDEFAVETMIAQLKKAFMEGADLTVEHSNPAHGSWFLENRDVVEGLGHLKNLSDARIVTAHNKALEEAAAEFLKRGTPVDIWAAKKIRALKGVH